MILGNINTKSMNLVGDQAINTMIDNTKLGGVMEYDSRSHRSALIRCKDLLSTCFAQSDNHYPTVIALACRQLFSSCN